MPSKRLALLARVLRKNPLEFVDRIQAFASNLRRRPPQSSPEASVPWEQAVAALNDWFSRDAVEQILQETALRETLGEIAERTSHDGTKLPFRPEHNADPVLASLSYLMTRCLRPAVIVESGVAHGVTTAVVLAALAENGSGHLHSIDLPPLVERGDDFVGCMVPHHLRDRWTLHLGTTVRVLPRLIPQIPPAGLFIHDSLFTLRNTTLELETISPHLAASAAVIVNSVQSSAAFDRWVHKRTPVAHLTIGAQTKRDHIGLAMLSNPPVQTPMDRVRRSAHHLNRARAARNSV